MPRSIAIIVNSTTFQAKSIVPVVIFYDPATIAGAPVKLSLYQIAPIKIVITTPLAIFPSCQTTKGTSINWLYFRIPADPLSGAPAVMC
jgi:hypothetical protein